MRKIKVKNLIITSFILLAFLVGGAFSNFSNYNNVYARGSSSHSAGGSFKSGSYSAPKSASSGSKSGSFSSGKSSSVNTGTSSSSAYNSTTKRSFIPIPFFIPFGHSYYGYASPLVSIVELVIFIILIIFIVRLFKKYKRRK